MTRPLSWAERVRAWLGGRWKQVSLLAALWSGITAVSFSPLWQAIEWAEFDWLSILTAPGSEGSPIVIVGIDEPSFERLDRLPWPWPRGLHAQLIEALHAAGAAVIAFDVLFAEPSAEDQRFIQAVRSAGNVVLAAIENRIETPHAVQMMRRDPWEALLEAGASAGLVSLGLDNDFTPRRLPVDPDSFWRKVLATFRGHLSEIDTGIAPGSLIRYAGPPWSFPYVSYYQALEPRTFLPPELIRNRIVLVGWATTSAPTPGQPQPDMLATPFVRASGQLTSGVEIQANIIATALRQDALQRAPLWGRLALLGAAAAVTLLTLSRWRPLAGAAWAAGLSAGLVAVAIGAFKAADLWLPVSAPIAGIWLAYAGQGGVAFFRERAQRAFIRRVFGLFVADEIIDHMLAHPEHLVLGGERREVSFIFTDLADFTALTEAIPPATLVDLLKDYFEGMSQIILAYHGTIERFIGDSLVAFFNAPVEQPDHPERAVACALELDAFAQRFAARQRARGIALGVTRIGVNTGEVSVGNFGGTKRFHYTAMGDPINTAARLEGANKYFGTRICVSSTTAIRCPALEFRPIGAIVLKGKTQPVEVLEPLPAGASAQNVERYRRAYKLLQACNPKALAAFAEIVARTPEDALSAYHLTRLKTGETGVRITLAGK